MTVGRVGGMSESIDKITAAGSLETKRRNYVKSKTGICTAY